MNYQEAETCRAETCRTVPCEPKQETIAFVTDELSGNMAKLSQMLNALCANMAGADTDAPKEIMSAPLLQRLVMLNDMSRYCIERTETLFKIMG